ncbi:MAG: SurA N-terminal domain-containing protein [Candidatus Aminicenantes bacterium]|nr:SurA N-terminal domain-containing protein [Candidatus Aminicenantes bacterium]
MRARSRRPILTVTWMALLCSIAGLSSAHAEIRDRVAALVGGEVITLSDVRWLIQYRGQTLPSDPAQRRLVYSAALDQLIEETLIASEAQNTPGAEILPAEIEARIEAYQQSFRSEGAFQEKLRSMGMSPGSLHAMILRQLAVQKFVQVRIQPFAIVVPREIEAYYRETFLPTVRDGPAPPLELLQNRIQEIVGLLKTNQELERWVTRARKRTEIDVLLFREPPQSSNLPQSLWSPPHTEPLPRR